MEYHILFVHSFIPGHWGCFYLLIIRNVATVNISVQVFHFPSMYLGVEWLSHSGNCIVGTNFQNGHTILYYHQNIWGFLLFPHSHQRFLLPDSSYPTSKYEMLSHCGLICGSLMTENVRRIFSCACWMLMYLWWDVCSAPLLILSLGCVLLLDCESRYSQYKSFIR